MKKCLFFVALCSFLFMMTTPTEAKQFPDVNHQTEMGRAIDFLSNEAVISGFPDGKFRPADRVTRGQAAKMLANMTMTNSRYAIDEMYQLYRPESFEDIPKNHQYFHHIEGLADYYVIGGYEDGTFKQGLHLTRAHIAKMIAYGYMLPTAESHFLLDDVPISSERYPYVSAVLTHDIMKETSRGKFSPNQYVTRGEFALFLYRAHRYALAQIALEKQYGEPFIERSSALGQLLQGHPFMDQVIYQGMDIAAARVTMNRSHYAYHGMSPLEDEHTLEYEGCSDYLDVLLCYGYMPDNRVNKVYLAFDPAENNISINTLQQTLGVKFEMEAFFTEESDIPYYIGTASKDGFMYTITTDFTSFNPSQVMDHSFELFGLHVLMYE